MKFGRYIRVGLFFLIPAVGSLTPLVVLPVLTAKFGAAGWTSVAVGQSIGTAAAVIADLGWSVVGPQLVARNAGRRFRRETYSASLATKILTIAIATPILAGAAFSLSSEHPETAIAVAISSAMGALSPAWYFTGLNRPLAILLIETLPRIAAALLSALLVALGAPLVIYGILTGLAWVITWCIAATTIGVRWWPKRRQFRATVAVFREHMPVTLGRIVSVAYTALPVSLVAAVSPASTANFASADRLMRMGLTVTSGLPSRLQSWVGQEDPAVRQRRSQASIFINLAMGFASALVYGTTAPAASSIVFSGHSTVGVNLAIVTGVVMLVMTTSRGLGLSIVAESLIRHLPLVNLVAAIVGVTLLPVLATLAGAVGAMAAIGAAELAGLLLQAALIFHARRSSSNKVEK